jgi:NADH-quinone oxidoreductase subunit M
MIHFLSAIGYERWILHVLLLLPLVGALPILLAPAALAKRIALVVTLVEFVLSLGLWWVLNTEPGTLQLTASIPWIPQWGVSYAVGMDGISMTMVLLTTLLMPLCVLGSWHYITQRERGYYALLLALLTGSIGVFVATDLFLFYVFWEVMLIPMYFIIGIWGGRNRLYAAIKFFLFTMAGSLLMLVAIIVLARSVAGSTGTLSFAYQHLLDHAGSVGRLAPWLFAAFALAFAIKVPVFPLHTWLPDAHVEAPTAGSVLLASVLLKMGTYGFIRFAAPFFPGVALSPWVTNLVLVLSLIGIVYGALVAMVQPDIKKLVAYSSVSHLGFVMLGIWAATVQSVQGAIMVMIGHGFSTGALFFWSACCTSGGTPGHRGLRRDCEGGAGLQPHLYGRGAVVDRAARTQRFHRRVSRAARQLPHPSLGIRHRDDRRDLRRGLPALGAAAHHLQPARQAREQRPQGSHRA